MMNRSVQHQCVQVAAPDLEELMKLTEDCTKERVREPEITKFREINSRQDYQDAERTKRFVGSRISHRWWRRLNFDEAYGAPSLFTWRY